MPKIFLILAALFCVGSVALGFMNKSKITVEREATAASELRANELGTQLTAANTKATELETARDSVIAELETARTDLASVRQELGAATSKVNSLTEQIAAKDTEIASAKTQIEQLQTAATANVSVAASDGTTMSAADAAIEIDTLKQQVEIAEQEKRLLGEKLEAAQSQMTALRLDAERRAAGVMARGLQGQVLAVNQAWGFVILSLGDRPGVASNAEMLVRRGDNLIGKVRITTVEPTTSVADIVPGSMQKGLRIQPGDVVIYPGAPVARSVGAPPQS